MTNPVFFTGDMEILNETLGGDAFPVICALTKYAETGVEADIGTFYQGQRIAYLLLKQKVEISLQKNDDAAAVRKKRAQKAAKARWAQAGGKKAIKPQMDGNDLNGTELADRADNVQGSGSISHEAEEDLTCTDCSEDADAAQTCTVNPSLDADQACSCMHGEAEDAQTCSELSEHAGNARTCTGRSEDAWDAQTGTVNPSSDADQACSSMLKDADNAQTDTDSSSYSSSCSLFISDMDIQDKDIQDTDTDHTDCIVYKSLYKTNACAREGKTDRWGYLGELVSEEELEALRRQRITEIPAIEQMMRDCGADFAPADEDIARELLAEYSCETILKAIRAAKEGGRVIWRYIRGILRNWKESEQHVGRRHSGKGRGPAGSGEPSGGAGKGSGNRSDSTRGTETKKYSDDLPEDARRYLRSITI